MNKSNVKNKCPDLRLSRMALTVAALTFSAAAVLTGCHGDAKFEPEQLGELTIEGGDYISGQPYLVTLKDAADIKAKIGTLSKINPVTGEEAGEFEWFYTVPLHYFTDYTIDYEKVGTITEQFTAVSSHGNEFSYTRELRQTDPYLADQWHIYNIGQNPYGMVKPPLKQIDMNVIPAWRTVHNGKLVSGEGVKIAVIDAPVDLNHEDLKDRVYTPAMQIPGSDGYVNTGLTLEQSKVTKDGDYSHGTSVAGIIAAAGGNEKGGRGIAYKANITSVGAEIPGREPQEKISALLSYVLKAGEFNIVSNSMGNDFFPENDPATYELFNEIYEQNIAYIQSMGNEFDEDGDSGDDDDEDSNNYHYVQICRQLKINCEFKQTDERARYPYVIQVGALDSLGKHASYSSTGSNLWITAAGGDSGYTTGSISSDATAAIVTTFSSYRWMDIGYTDEIGAPWINSEDKQYYTQTMNGTSAAAPMVSGAAALAYQVKPDLTVSQLRYLLAKTARNDKAMSTLKLEIIKTDKDQTYEKPIVYDYGWQDNAAGMRFSSYYGFGVVDAGELVKAAAKCSDDPVCTAMAQPPEVYTSSNKTACRYGEVISGSETKVGESNIVCTFTGFTNNDDPDKTLSEESITLDAVTFDFFGFVYDAGNQVYSSCKKLASTESEEQREGMSYANAMLQIEMISPSGTVSLVKPLYANWGYSHVLNSSATGSVSDSLQLATSTFYLEKFRDDPEKPFTIRFKTGCNVDLDSLNNNINITVYGRK